MRLLELVRMGAFMSRHGRCLQRQICWAKQTAFLSSLNVAPPAGGLPSSYHPKRCHCHALSSQRDTCHGGLAPSCGGCQSHPDIRETLFEQLISGIQRTGKSGWSWQTVHRKDLTVSYELQKYSRNSERIPKKKSPAVIAIPQLLYIQAFT